MIQYALRLANIVFTKSIEGMMSSLPNLFRVIKIFSFTSIILIFYKLYLYSSSEEPPHALPVFLEGPSPSIREAEPGVGPLIHEGLLHLYVSSLLQPRHVSTKVAECEACLVHEVQEVGGLQHKEVGHNEEPCWLVDEPVDLIQGGEVFIAR